MMAEQHQIWQGTVWTGLTNEEGERLCPEVLPWADPYIAALVDKHRWQAVLFAMQPDSDDDDEAFWDDESCDDPVPPLPADPYEEEFVEQIQMMAWFAQSPTDESTEEYRPRASTPDERGSSPSPAEEFQPAIDALNEVFGPCASLRRAQGDLS